MELESLAGCEFMRRKAGERKTIKAIWKCYFCGEMVVNLHLLAEQTVVEGCWRELIALMHLDSYQENETFVEILDL